jgi:type IV pilus assembly protein PilA
MPSQATHVRDDQQSGFTLIELIVVVSIIAVLLTLAIPTYLGAQTRSRDRVAQADLRIASNAVRAIAVEDDGLFPSITGPGLTASESALDYVAGSGTNSAVGWNVVIATDPQRVQLSRISASGTAFGVRLESDGSVFFCKGAIASVDDTTDSCIDRRW